MRNHRDIQMYLLGAIVDCGLSAPEDEEIRIEQTPVGGVEF